MTIDIIGAGIGGLTTAIALEQKGFNVRIFEQAKIMKPVGAGIIIANNAMQVFKKLGLNEIIEKQGNPISSMNVVDKSLEPISKINLKYFENKYQLQNIAIHRAKLQDILLNHLKNTQVYLEHELTNIKRTQDDGFYLGFNNGALLKSEALIGADGINSKTRKLLFKEDEFRSTNQVCWRGIANCQLPNKLKNELNEAWGYGDRLGFVQIEESKVYWFAVKSFKNNESELNDKALNSYFSKYHDLIKKILLNTPSQSIHKTVIKDLKPLNTWVNKNVCLLGDAAHATTPNLGQGACQAIEDAYVLSQCLSKYELNVAFREYQKLRFSKANLVVKRSWSIGKIAHWKQPVLSKIRNSLMKLTPESINQKLTAKIFELQNI